MTTAAPKAPPTMAVASHPASGSPRRLPEDQQDQEPGQGRAGISQTSFEHGGCLIP